MDTPFSIQASWSLRIPTVGQHCIACHTNWHVVFSVPHDVQRRRIEGDHLLDCGVRPCRVDHDRVGRRRAMQPTRVEPSARALVSPRKAAPRATDRGTIAHDGRPIPHRRRCGPRPGNRGGRPVVARPEERHEARDSKGAEDRGPRGEGRADRQDRGPASLLRRNDPSPAESELLAKHGINPTSFIGTNNPFRYREGVLEEGEIVSVVGMGRWVADPDAPATGDAYRDAPKRLILEAPPGSSVLVSDDPSTATR